MAIEVRTRVVADIYRGIDFPDDWVAHSTDITVAMGRELVASVIALLDDEGRPVAACWEMAEGGEQFARSRFDTGADTDVLEGLESDLAKLEQLIGVSTGLFSALLWEPRTLSRSQAQPIQKEAFARGRYSATLEWNMAPREIFANAGDLILMIRDVDKNVSGQIPATASAMHQVNDADGAETFVILPVKPGSPGTLSAPVPNGPLKALLFAAATLVGIALVSAYLAGDI